MEHALMLVVSTYLVFIHDLGTLDFFFVGD